MLHVETFSSFATLMETLVELYAPEAMAAMWVLTEHLGSLLEC
jgi:hypothetical protein